MSTSDVYEAVIQQLKMKEVQANTYCRLWQSWWFLDQGISEQTWYQKLWWRLWTNFNSRYVMFSGIISCSHSINLTLILKKANLNHLIFLCVLSLSKML
jgi:hypothetical protein